MERNKDGWELVEEKVSTSSYKTSFLFLLPKKVSTKFCTMKLIHFDVKIKFCTMKLILFLPPDLIRLCFFPFKITFIFYFVFKILNYFSLFFCFFVFFFVFGFKTCFNFIFLFFPFLKIYLFFKKLWRSYFLFNLLF